MKIAQGVETIEIYKDFGSARRTIFPALLYDDKDVVLVDTGYPGLFPMIREAVSKTDVPFGRIGRVIITHQDFDHIGSLPDLVSALGGRVEVIAHELEKPYIEGERPLIKTTPLEKKKLLDSMPEDARPGFEAMLSSPPRAKVDRAVKDGEELPFCGGITVIFTPGHTDGHISLYHKKSKTLIPGDAMIVQDGVLCGPRPPAAKDLELAVRSLRKFTHFDVETVLCFHGGVYNKDANARIRELAGGE